MKTGPLTTDTFSESSIMNALHAHEAIDAVNWTKDNENRSNLSFPRNARTEGLDIAGELERWEHLWFVYMVLRFSPAVHWPVLTLFA